MIAPYRLRRRREPGPAVALLFPSPDVSGLFRLCAGLGLDPSGRLFRVSDGFLIKLHAPTPRAVPGVVRLRALAPDLLIPVDSDLVPALLDDEAAGLVRDRGLIFLPWGDPLAFDPRSPIELSSVLVADLRPRRTWGPLPARKTLTERFEEIVVDREDESPATIIESGGESIGTETPRPEPSDATSTLIGNAQLGAGRALVWLGNALHLKSLSAFGSSWIAGAMAIAPRLSEAVLGRQGAALQALLKEFREGDLEKALRNALPLGEPGGGRGSVPELGDRLPTHNARYSLDDLLEKRKGHGPSSVWLGGQDVFAELTSEYRRAAVKAMADGDCRRAAYIYGKLLQDYHMAAHSLIRGGLYHDAAILLLNRLDDPKGAARAFEACGEIDRAIQLYRQSGENVSAGDLLRRIGEDEAALEEYRAAAERLAAIKGGDLAAGRLMLTKAGRPDLALGYFRRGWDRRPEANSLACALEALPVLLESGTGPELRRLLDEADLHLASTGQEAEAALYYNTLARLSGGAAPESLRDDLRDRALVGLASKLRQQVRPGVAAGRLVSDLLGQSGLWPAPVVRDADFAARAESKGLEPLPRPARSKTTPTRLRGGIGAVTAVCYALESDEVFFGLQGGEVFCFRPERAEVVRVAGEDSPVTAIEVRPDGQTLAVFRAARSKQGTLSAYVKNPDGSYTLSLATKIADTVDPWLTPVLATDGEDLVGLWDGEALYFLEMTSLQSKGSLVLPTQDESPTAALLVPRPIRPGSEFAVFVHDGHGWSLHDPFGKGRRPTGLLWRPALPEPSTLRSVPVSWSFGAGGHIEVAGLGSHGTLHWAAFQAEDDQLTLLASNTDARLGGYLAAAVVRPGLVVGVTRTRVEWLRCGGDRFSFSFSTELSIPSAVACYASRRTGQLIVVCDDGFIARVPIPNGR